MLGKGLSSFTEIDIDRLLNQLSGPNLHIQYAPGTWQEFDPESRAISQYRHSPKENFYSEFKAACSFGSMPPEQITLSFNFAVEAPWTDGYLINHHCTMKN